MTKNVDGGGSRRSLKGDGSRLPDTIIIITIIIIFCLEYMNVTYKQTDVWTPQTHKPRWLKVKCQTFQQWPIQEIPKWGRQSAELTRLTKATYTPKPVIFRAIHTIERDNITFPFLCNVR